MKSREIIVAILVAGGVVLVGLVLLGLLWGFGGMWGSGSMWGFPTHMGTSGMMGGLPALVWFLFCLGPLFLGALLVGGIVWLLSNRDKARPDISAALETCPNCGQPVQKNWNNCPNCGQSLRGG